LYALLESDEEVLWVTRVIFQELKNLLWKF
jgi:hypothetical protein